MVGKVAIIDCGSSKVPEIESSLDEINVSYETYPLADFDKEIPNHIEGIIISGSPFLIKDRDADELRTTYQFITKLNLPILGICFGHQLLGLVNGANVTLMEEDRDWQTIEIKDSSILFNNIEQPMLMKQDHTEEIELPNNFKLLATSVKCKNEAMQHKFLPHFGVQFHPESSEQQGLQLIKNFITGF